MYTNCSIFVRDAQMILLREAQKMFPPYLKADQFEQSDPDMEAKKSANLVNPELIYLAWRF